MQTTMDVVISVLTGNIVSLEEQIGSLERQIKALKDHVELTKRLTDAITTAGEITVSVR